MTPIRFSSLLVLALLAAACAGPAPQAGAGDAEAAVPAQSRAAAAPAAEPGGVVDSIFPPEEALRRFRQGLPAVERLEGGERSRDALVRRFVRAVETEDTAALRRMVATRAEFAYLLFPGSRYTRPPFVTQPSLLWFQMQMNSEKGIVRVLRRHGGEDAGFVGYTCEEEATLESGNRLWERCAIRRRLPGAGEDTIRWFGSVVERDGHFKFVTYANGL